MSDQAKLKEAKEVHESWLKEQPGFQGVGIGVDASATLCLKIFTNNMPKETRDQIDQRMINTPFEFEEVGPVRKQ